MSQALASFNKTRHIIVYYEELIKNRTVRTDRVNYVLPTALKKMQTCCPSTPCKCLSFKLAIWVLPTTLFVFVKSHMNFMISVQILNHLLSHNKEGQAYNFSANISPPFPPYFAETGGHSGLSWDTSNALNKPASKNTQRPALGAYQELGWCQQDARWNSLWKVPSCWLLSNHPSTDFALV